MHLTKCDICRKNLQTSVMSDSAYVQILYANPYKIFHFCERCAKPVIAFLQKNALLPKSPTN